MFVNVSDRNEAHENDGRLDIAELEAGGKNVAAGLMRCANAQRKFIGITFGLYLDCIQQKKNETYTHVHNGIFSTSSILSCFRCKVPFYKRFFHFRVKLIGSTQKPVNSPSDGSVIKFTAELSSPTPHCWEQKKKRFSVLFSDHAISMRKSSKFSIDEPANGFRSKC
jgi:hypothetical protein